jgi:tellurite resistance protein TehA-like permease
LLADVLPFLKGFTLFFWAAGTWWIPLLFVLGFWRHVRKRFPLRYDPQYWGMVFPLGMYTVCTFQLSKALGYAPLMILPRVFVFLAPAAWLAAFAGLARRLLFRRGGA